MSLPAPGLVLRGAVCWPGHPPGPQLAVDFPAGCWSALLGPSGCGKSTLLRLVAGLPCAAQLQGRLVAGDGASLSGRVALMGQSDQLLPWADALDNVTLGARLAGQRPDRGRALDLLEAVGLAGLARRRPAALSGGQRQRVALARTLYDNRPLVLLDEPFSALDARTRAQMQDLTVRLLAGRSVILVTHDPLEAARLAERAWLMGPDGAEALSLPPGPVPRPMAEPAVLQAQASLFTRLCA